MKTAKIESYRFDFVSYRFAMELIAIELNRYCALYFNNFKKEKKENRGLITFSFHIATQFAMESLCLLIYMHHNTCFP